MYHAPPVLPMPENRDPPRVSSRSDVSRLVNEALEDQKERTRRRDAVPSRVRKRGSWAGPLAAVLMALAAWLWLAPPAFIRPEPLLEIPPEAVDAGLRMDLYVASLRIEAYRDSVGQLPAGLDLVLDSAEAQGLVYEVLGGGIFRLTGVRDELAVVHTSDRPAADLVGDVLPAMRRGG